ncbi:hypothetical protein [Nocardia seriolae]|uniref:hypothetical protein n=1 Tax=Nocardia seriolae TaxID=37332 RepID=UPI0008FF5130|nr:hypothetical protein [Nocardia seriolae]OJF79723.1 hypothetical protein NS14008_11590 [Nocardia seriolae]PSK26612.1 hypothetical protein C6575_36350 [Nocardia seriolae]QUN16142.1 hypothetical protein KEC46_28265 [Nocardia seriolae]WNJ56804.1 hypothetical protein RMO66_25500 [Nocardia seriolae]
MPRDVRGNWDLHQGNGFTLHMEIADEDGEGSFDGRVNVHGKAGFTGLADTRATDDELTFQMGNGRYTGRFDFQGRLTGVTFDVAHPQSQATWWADKLFGFM